MEPSIGNILLCVFLGLIFLAMIVPPIMIERARQSMKGHAQGMRECIAIKTIKIEMGKYATVTSKGSRALNYTLVPKRWSRMRWLSTDAYVYAGEDMAAVLDAHLEGMSTPTNREETT